MKDNKENCLESGFPHCWQPIGIDKGNIIFRCTQCGKCYKEKIVYVKEGE